MTYHEVVLALRHEKELLEEVLSLSEHQVRLMEDGTLDAFELFWQHLAAPMTELAEAEKAVDTSLAELERNHALTSEETHEIALWNAAISDLADRVADIGEKTSTGAERLFS